MRDQTELVVALIAANDGEIVGKNRLQKTVYLLDACGLNSGFEFENHNYSPSSFDLALETDVAVSSGFIESEKHPGFHQVPYTVFTSVPGVPVKEIDAFNISDPQEKLDLLEQHSAIVLELASTLLYYKELGDREEIENRVRRLKPLKATPERLEKAWNLLSGLGIDVPQGSVPPCS